MLHALSEMQLSCWGPQHECLQRGHTSCIAFQIGAKEEQVQDSSTNREHQTAQDFIAKCGVQIWLHATRRHRYDDSLNGGEPAGMRRSAAGCLRTLAYWRQCRVTPPLASSSCSRQPHSRHHTCITGQHKCVMDDVVLRNLTDSAQLKPC